MANKKKILTSAVAVATAATLLLGGTFAWQSISQTALNEKEAVINPGGRLHDDFNGTNKDVYVENFADNDIFARVRLDEYFEIVANKGVTGAEKTEIITTGAAKDDTSTYITHKFNTANNTDAYWNWQTGGSTTYMPTFNKNKDSLVADINGTFAADYTDYVDYSSPENAEKTATEIYDGDSNNIDEVGTDFANLENYAANIKTVENRTHNAAATKTTAGLISMEDWLALNGGEYSEETHKDYWVYDTDGWCYWSAPIKAGTATGLLLDEIGLKNIMDDSYYYAINVVGQFITADDLGKTTRTGFYDPNGGATPSDNALELLAAIGVDTSGDELPSPLSVSVAADADWYIEGSESKTINLTASATYDEAAVSDENLANVSWRLSGNSSDETTFTQTTGKTTSLRISAAETGNLYVYATLTYEGETQEGSSYIQNGPVVQAAVLYYEGGDAVSAVGNYAAGTNTYEMEFYADYLGDISKYDRVNAYKDDAKTALDKKINYELVPDNDTYEGNGYTIEGVTVSKSGSNLVLNISDSVKQKIYVSCDVDGYAQFIHSFVPKVTDVTLSVTSATDNEVNTEGDNITVTVLNDDTITPNTVIADEGGVGYYEIYEASDVTVATAGYTVKTVEQYGQTNYYICADGVSEDYDSNYIVKIDDSCNTYTSNTSLSEDITVTYKLTAIIADCQFTKNITLTVKAPTE